MTITPPTQRYYCAPDGNVHGQDIFETLFQSPNHEHWAISKKLKLGYGF